MAEENRKITFKCKPTYQFQSIEFDFVCESQEDEDLMIETYDRVLKKLMKITPIQEKQAPQLPKEPLATARQKEIMDQFGIKYTATTTTKEAQKLIQKSIDG